MNLHSHILAEREDGDKRMKKIKSAKAKARKKRTAVKVVKCEIRGQKVLQTRDEDGHIVSCFWGLTPKQERAITNPIVERKQKKRRATKRKTLKYNPQELFEKLAKTHQQIADSLKNDKRQSTKRRYHEELVETFDFLAKKDYEKDQDPDNLTRIPPMFKGALLMTMPEEFKRMSRRINKLEKGGKSRD